MEPARPPVEHGYEPGVGLPRSASGWTMAVFGVLDRLGRACRWTVPFRLLSCTGWGGRAGQAAGALALAVSERKPWPSSGARPW